MNKFVLISCCGLLIFTGSGCVFERVKPWEREVLAREDMQLEASSLDQLSDKKIFFSKEASKGGQSLGGGGCGCN